MQNFVALGKSYPLVKVLFVAHFFCFHLVVVNLGFIFTYLFFMPINHMGVKQCGVSLGRSNQL